MKSPTHKAILTTIALLAAPALSHAQATDTGTDDTPGKRSPFRPYTVLVPTTTYPFTISLDTISLTGPGVGLAWRFSHHLGISANYNNYKFNLDEVPLTDNLDYNISLHLRSIPLTLDLYPSRASTFHFRLGVARNGNQVTATSPASDDFIDLGNDGPFDSRDIGDIHATIKQASTNFYFSMAGDWFYIGRRHHIAIGGELGLMYGGKTTATLTRNGPPDPAIDASLKQEEALLRDNVSNINIWPVLKISLRYAF